MLVSGTTSIFSPTTRASANSRGWVTFQNFLCSSLPPSWTLFGAFHVFSSLGDYFKIRFIFLDFYQVQQNRLHSWGYPPSPNPFLFFLQELVQVGCPVPAKPKQASDSLPCPLITNKALNQVQKANPEGAWKVIRRRPTGLKSEAKETTT